MWQGHKIRGSQESASLTWFTNQICVVFFVGFAFQLEVYLIQLYVIKFVKGLRQVGRFLWVLWFSPSIKLPRYNWNIVESGVKHHKPKKPKPEYEWNRQCDDMFLLPTKLSYDITEIVLKVAFNTITVTTKFEPAKIQVKKHISTAQRKIAYIWKCQILLCFQIKCN